MTDTNRLAAKPSLAAKFWQNSSIYFKRSFDTLQIDHTFLSVLSTPKRILTVSCPIRLDDGRIQTFTGFRVQHNNALGPFKGGLRYDMNVDRDEVMALAMLPVPARTSPVTVTADGPVAEFVGPTVLAKNVPALMTVPRV